MKESRFEKQLKFLIEVDKMKTVLRQTILTDRSRQETDAEHSWHFALMALALSEYSAYPDLDMFKVVKMALVHDLVEVYAGDTFAYDEAGYLDKQEREIKAADRIFGMLPEDQASEFRSLWEEFEEMKTPEAIYAAAIDRLQPFINNSVTDGHTWRLHGVTSDKVYKRMEVIKQAIPDVWVFVENVIQDAIKKGFIKEFNERIKNDEYQ
ncbi:MAG TPA: HD domain-containing protein [Clostridiales bacterium]|nr:HD domain-containing protein [Clostridiales bacterium]